MAGKIVADIIESAGSQISLNVGNVTILTASSSGLTLTPTSNVNINVSSSTLAFGAGSVSLPSITTSGDTNTGLFFPAADTIAFAEGGAEAMRINSSGNLQANGTISVGNTTPSTSGAGITFPATQSASTNANTLDDYEEGTWTPVAARYTGGSITAVYGGSNAGKYTKIGRLVTIECYVDITSVSAQGSSLSQITGLPFTPVTSYQATGAVFFNAAVTTINIVSGAVNAGDNCIYLHESGNANGLASFNWKDGALTLSISYMI